MDTAASGRAPVGPGDPVECHRVASVRAGDRRFGRRPARRVRGAAGTRLVLAGRARAAQDEERQACYWEIKKLLTLALKANPNALECLYSPLVETITPDGEVLLAIRAAFLSKVIYATYKGYALSQFKKMSADRRVRGEINWKHAMHLIRAMMAGITTLREGHLPLDVDEHRDALLAIRRGEVPWGEVEAWRLSLHREFDRAVAETSLPD